jgi:hypothetical protein
MKVDVFLPRDFLLACDLYYEQPEKVIQQFMESVSLAEYYSGKTNKEKQYGTSFFLEFQMRPNSRPFPAKKIREKYLDYQTIVWDTINQLENIDSKLELLDQFYREWHFELIKNISKNDVIINQAERKKFFGYKFK